MNSVLLLPTMLAARMQEGSPAFRANSWIGLFLGAVHGNRRPMTHEFSESAQNAADIRTEGTRQDEAAMRAG
jgi:hypothetical protein